MSEQLSTRRCDTPLLQAFVDNRTILVKIAARITGCRSRAEDVVQDAFFRLQSAPQITSSFKAQLSYLSSATWPSITTASRRSNRNTRGRRKKA